MKSMPVVVALALAMSVLGWGWSSADTHASTAPPAIPVTADLLPSEAVFSSVRDVVMAGEDVWVLDAVPPYVTRVTRTTGAVLQFGSEGDGPGELRDPRAMQLGRAPDGAPELWVWDFFRRRVFRFDMAGTFVSSRPIEMPIRARSDISEVSYADPFRIRSYDGAVVLSRYAHRIDRPADMASGWLDRTDLTLVPGEAVLTLAAPFAESVPETRIWAPLPLWDVCDGTLTVWNPNKLALERFDRSDVPLASHPVALGAYPVTIEDIGRYLRHMARLELGPGFEDSGLDLDRMARSLRGDFEREGPIATDIRCGGRGDTWLRLFGTEIDPLGRGARWARVGPSGSVDLIDFGNSFTPWVFDGTGAIGLTDTLDGQRLARWDMEAGRTETAQ